MSGGKPKVDPGTFRSHLAVGGIFCIPATALVPYQLAARQYQSSSDPPSTGSTRTLIKRDVFVVQEKQTMDILKNSRKFACPTNYLIRENVLKQCLLRHDHISFRDREKITSYLMHDCKRFGSSSDENIYNDEASNNKYHFFIVSVVFESNFFIVKWFDLKLSLVKLAFFESNLLLF